MDYEVAGTALRAHLSELAAYLAAGDTAGARAAIARTTDALVSADDVPDAAAIGLVLDHATTLLDSARKQEPK
ncbi:MAG: hypothetical protein H7Z74_12545 [Anaerolineae bacterium]|nr:hypothetical protein [Gemmatimonadaceae bacterium]